jgi:DNA-binding response OmpR family regulator
MKKPKILHVDDDPDLREITKLALEAIGGMEVCQCADAKETLACAPTLAPDLMLLDVMMPGISGQDLLLELRKLPGYDTLPVVFLTAKATRDELDRLMEMQIDDIVTKPFDVLELPNLLQEILFKDHGKIRLRTGSVAQIG